MNMWRRDSLDGPPVVTLERAAELMRASEPVIFPTETFYALGSRALDSDATARVFVAKHRSTVRPLPLIIGHLNQLEQVAKVSESVQPLLERFWPGPLSVLFPAHLRVPDVLTGGTGRVAVRLSSHPVACALASAVGEPITSSSANMSGKAPVIAADALDPELIATVSGVLDLPPIPAGGLPSTLVEHTVDGLRILREGAVSRQQLEEAGWTVLP